MPVSLVLVKKETKKTITKSTSDLTIANPNGVDKNYPYFNEAISALKKGIMRPQDGYVLQDREILGRRAREIIENTLFYLVLKSGGEGPKRQEATKRFQSFRSQSSVIGDFDTISRAKFAKLLVTSLGIPLVHSSDKVWMDEAGEFKDVITTLRVNYAFSWKDSFGSRYFQGDKNITVGEALYMVEQVLR